MVFILFVYLILRNLIIDGLLAKPFAIAKHSLSVWYINHNLGNYDWQLLTIANVCTF